MVKYSEKSKKLMAVILMFNIAIGNKKISKDINLVII